MSFVTTLNERLRILAISLAGILFVSSSLADTSWPAEEAGATTAGFSEQGIAALDAAMKQIDRQSVLSGQR